MANALVDAIRSVDIPKIRTLLETRPELISTSYYGTDYPIHAAAEKDAPIL